VTEHPGLVAARSAVPVPPVLVQSKKAAVRDEDVSKTLAKLEAKVEKLLQEQGRVHMKPQSCPCNESWVPAARLI